MNELIAQWVSKIPNIAGYESWISTVISSSMVLLAAAIAFVIAKRVFVYLIHKLFAKTTSDLDDILIRRKVFICISLYSAKLGYLQTNAGRFARLLSAGKFYFDGSCHLQCGGCGNGGWFNNRLRYGYVPIWFSSTPKTD